jgi:hypothetical protein
MKTDKKTLTVTTKRPPVQFGKPVSGGAGSFRLEPKKHKPPKRKGAYERRTRT